MENTNVRQEETRSRFFGELSLQLREKGIISERKGANILRVYLDGEPVCDVHSTSNVFSCEGRKESEEANELQYETARIARNMGYKKVITYTLESENGASLRAANFTKRAVKPLSLGMGI